MHPSLCLLLQALTRPLQDDTSTIFDRYTDGRGPPRIHPVITYVGEEWDRNGDVNSLKHMEVLKLCEKREEEYPSWNPKLYLQDLPTLLDQQELSDRWWLPPTHVDDEPGA